ncbi:MAG: hypothetical protein RR314_05685 [Oscillospiraceae bacterium]
MKKVEYLGNVHYEVTGEREEDAAYALEQGLLAVSKRRNSYVQSEIDEITANVCKTYGVTISLKVDK